jgi:hypothetical protein
MERILSICAVHEDITDEHLHDVYSDSYIIAKIGHDHRPAAPISHPLVTYLTATVDGAFAGAFLFVKRNACDLEMHALLKRSVVQHSRDLGRAAIDWGFEHHSVLRISAPVIEGLESARNYGLRIGMKQEGFMRDVCTQGGIIKGIYLLAITRRDWESKS